jgi:predicted ATPase
MADDPRVQQLLDELLDSDATPEVVCAEYPELLPVVRVRWRQMRRLRADLDALFPPPDVPTPPPDALHTPPPEPTPPPLGAATALPQIPGYEVEAVLGRGGMGIVYKARHLRLNRLVAVKILPREFAQDRRLLQRFQREARAASALNHPHICTIYDIDEHEGQPYLVMELIEGRTLRALAARRPSLPELVHLVGHVAKALAAVHAAGIIHRDIKPENIMVRADGYAKVVDFGLARTIPLYSTPSEATSDPVTDPGTVMGTVRYMAPEQLLAEAASSASDLFSLGIVLYELVTGRHPFAGDSPTGTFHAHLWQPPLRPSLLNPEIPAALEALILQMLEKEPRLRPTAAELDATLAELTRRGTGVVLGPAPPAVPRHTVGRQAELAELRDGFESVIAGRGLFLCVTGEPGIGKTTLVEDFLAELAGGPCAVGRGSCSERLAGAEAFLPFLEALASLLRGPGGEVVARVMKVVAPTWYAQVVPHAAEDSSSALVPLEERAASPERLKRELGALLQEVSPLRALVLFLDDLHWADASTVDLLAYIGSKCATLRLLLVLTYRPTELLFSDHPFVPVKQDLQARGVCREVVLGFLSRPDMDRYLNLEFPQHRFPDELGDLIHAKTEGNPLFMVDLLRHLRDRQVLAQEQGRWVLAQSLPDLQRELPESVRSLIERKIAKLGKEDRRVLVAASVQGYEFDAAVVAEALALDAAEVEEQLERLERVHAFFRLVGEHEFPDRTLTLRCRFVHVLYQNALYASLRPTRRVTLSAAVAKALLRYHGEKSTVVAGELALLWEAAREFARAADCCLRAAQNAARLFANQEVIMLARRGLELLKSLPDAPKRDQLELNLEAILVPALINLMGQGATDVERVFARARELCQRVGSPPQLYPALWGSWYFSLVGAEFQKARELGEQLLALAQDLQDPAHLLLAHRVLGHTLFFPGGLAQARAHLEQGMALYDPHRHRSLVSLYGQDPGVVCHLWAALTLWMLGYPDQALREKEAAFNLARELAHPYSQAWALVFGAWFHHFRREEQAIPALAEANLTLSREQGFAQLFSWGTMWQGWSLVVQGQAKEGIAQLLYYQAAFLQQNIQLLRPSVLGLLADAYGKAGQAEDGLITLDEALGLVHRTGERHGEADLYRLKGELLLALPAAHQAEAEACFRQAIAIARSQSAKSWELRAILSLSRLYHQQGKTEEARPMLAEICSWFTEGFDTPDLQEARALLEVISQGERAS